MKNLLEKFKQFGYSETPNKILIDNLALWLEKNVNNRELFFILRDKLSLNGVTEIDLHIEVDGYVEIREVVEGEE